jgi:hypothetical protein
MVGPVVIVAVIAFAVLAGVWQEASARRVEAQAEQDRIELRQLEVDADLERARLGYEAQAGRDWRGTVLMSVVIFAGAVVLTTVLWARHQRAHDRAPVPVASEAAVLRVDEDAQRAALDAARDRARRAALRPASQRAALPPWSVSPEGHMIEREASR